MNIFETLYLEKDIPQEVSSNLEKFLLFEIYSPTIIRLAHNCWENFPNYVKDSIHPEIRELIQKSDDYSNKELKDKISAHTIVRAINILMGYKKCPIPLTHDKTIPRISKNLLSKRGEYALKRLLHAVCHGEWTDEMLELALRSSHKFLFDMSYYNTPRFSMKAADVFMLQSSKDGKTHFDFPVVQLTQGCLNHCSHCFCDAQNHLSYMPYPVWRGLFESLSKYYKYFEGQIQEEYVIKHKLSQKNEMIELFPPRTFSRFFHSSDPSHYYDQIMGVDGGDVALFVKGTGGYYYFLTKGVTNNLSRRAIAKAAMATSIDISFVDTPKENITHNIHQVQETLNLIHSIPTNKGVGCIAHTRLKTPSVNAQKIFPNEIIGPQFINPSGRANQFPDSELTFEQDVRNTYTPVINPNGDVVIPFCENRQYEQKKIANLFTGKER